jgi:hypothetical protein
MQGWNKRGLRLDKGRTREDSDLTRAGHEMSWPWLELVKGRNKRRVGQKKDRRMHGTKAAWRRRAYKRRTRQESDNRGGPDNGKVIIRSTKVWRRARYGRNIIRQAKTRSGQGPEKINAEYEPDNRRAAQENGWNREE